MGYWKVFLFLLLFPLAACNDDDRIALPIAEEYNCSLNSSLNVGDFHTVRSQEELLEFVSESDASANGLFDIDFSAYTLLLGKESFRNVPECSYAFYQEGGTYHLDVEIRPTLAPAFTVFEYGVLVEKLPQNAQVICSVTKK